MTILLTDNTVLYITLVVALALVGCEDAGVHGAKPLLGHSPYERYLPKTPPSEKNRVAHPNGFSVVSPPGWTIRSVPVEDYLKDLVADELILEGNGGPATPRITVQRVGAAGQRQWNDALNPGRQVEEGYKPTRFQGEPAFTHFLPSHSHSGTGAHNSLSQQVVLRSHGQWFILTFEMKNTDQGAPYYTHALKIIDDYFETFRYQPSRR